MGRFWRGVSFCAVVMWVVGCDRLPTLVAAADGPGAPNVRLFDGIALQRRASFQAFDATFTGGVRVAVGDLNGDGLPDLIIAAGPGGGPHVRVRDGRSGQVSRDFFPYDTNFVGGVFVAAGDVNGDGRDDIITGAGPGGTAHVKVFDGTTGAELHSFFAFTQFGGGVRVAAGDVNGDGKADIITGAGPGGAPLVNVFNGVTLAPLLSFFAYAPTFAGGVFVSSGDVNGDGLRDVVTGADAGGGPHVKVFSGAGAAELLSFFAFDAGFTGGVRVAAGDVNGDGRADVLCGPGPGGGPAIRTFNGATGAQISEIQAFDTGFNDGIFVAQGFYTLASLATLQGS